MQKQLTLSLQLNDDATFANFYVGTNAEVVHALQSSIEQEQFIYLWGAEGVGKSHLLQACAHAASDRGLAVVYLNLAEHDDFSPQILEGLEQLALVCIDNVDAAMADDAWEEALFHLYNRMREVGSRLVVAGNALPKLLAIRMPDLQSRFAWGLMLKVEGLQDDEKLEALQMRADRRGMSLPDEVGQFLLRHYPRDMLSLFAVLECLDQASLAAQRRLTVPFVKSVLGLPTRS